MAANTVAPLNADVARRISSGQAITSVHAAVKELCENALDAGATTIDVRLEDGGLQLLSVADNGTGIRAEDLQYVCQRHHTSKLRAFEELDSVQTYGFRGEALNSLCALADVHITSRAETADIGTTVTLGHHGGADSTTAAPRERGTTVVARHLFSNLPVRRQSASSKFKAEEKAIEETVIAMALVHPACRFVLKNGTQTLVNKAPCASVKDAVRSIYGADIANNLQEFQHTSGNGYVTFTGYLPQPSSDMSVMSRNKNTRCFLYVNNRPIATKDIITAIVNKYTQHVARTNADTGKRYPFIFLNCTVQNGEVDVNMDPNKQTVMFQKLPLLIEHLNALLDTLYALPAESTPPRASDPIDNASAPLSSTPMSSSQSHTTISSPRFTPSSFDDEDLRNTFLVTRPQPSPAKSTSSRVAEQDIAMTNSAIGHEDTPNDAVATSDSQQQPHQPLFTPALSAPNQNAVLREQQQRRLRQGNDPIAAAVDDDRSPSPATPKRRDETTDRWSPKRVRTTPTSTPVSKTAAALPAGQASVMSFFARPVRLSPSQPEVGGASEPASVRADVLPCACVEDRFVKIATRPSDQLPPPISMSPIVLAKLENSDSIYAVLRSRQVWLLHYKRLLEHGIAQQLMLTMALPRDPLETPIFLDPEAVGGSDAWSLLCQLETVAVDRAVQFVCERNIALNGFDICFRQAARNTVRVIEVKAMCRRAIDDYGLADLRLLLQMMVCQMSAKVDLLSTNDFLQLKDRSTVHRPPRVREFILADAKRQANEQLNHDANVSAADVEQAVHRSHDDWEAMTVGGMRVFVQVCSNVEQVPPPQ